MEQTRDEWLHGLQATGVRTRSGASRGAGPASAAISGACGAPCAWRTPSNTPVEGPASEERPESCPSAVHGYGSAVNPFTEIGRSPRRDRPWGCGGWGGCGCPWCLRCLRFGLRFCWQRTFGLGNALSVLATLAGCRQRPLGVRCGGSGCVADADGAFWPDCFFSGVSGPRRRDLKARSTSTDRPLHPHETPGASLLPPAKLPLTSGVALTPDSPLEVASFPMACGKRADLDAEISRSRRRGSQAVHRIGLDPG